MTPVGMHAEPSCWHHEGFLNGCACWQGEMQEALTQVQSGIAAAEEELKKTKAQPLVTVSIESLIKEAPKPAAMPGKLKRTSLASSLFGGSKKEEPAEPAAAASGAVREGQGWADSAGVLEVLGVCVPACVCWQRSEPSLCPALPTLQPVACRALL